MYGLGVSGERACVESRGGGTGRRGVPGTTGSSGEESVEGALVGHDRDLRYEKGWRKGV